MKMSRTIRTSIVCFVCAVAGCILHPNLGCAQSNTQEMLKAQDWGSFSARNETDIAPALNQQNLQPPLVNLTVPRLDQVVKVVFDRETNLIVLIGTKADIEKVKQTILLIDSKLGRDHDPITEKIRLRFQLAETVAEILSNSTALKGTGLEIQPVHFPEAVLLTGRSTIVERAKSIIREIDSHPHFER